MYMYLFKKHHHYSGQTVDSLGTVNHILNNNELSMVLHAGDLSYADCNARKWDIYGELIGT
jgi:hypothetical protein